MRHALSTAKSCAHGVLAEARVRVGKSLRLQPSAVSFSIAICLAEAKFLWRVAVQIPADLSDFLNLSPPPGQSVLGHGGSSRVQQTCRQRMAIVIAAPWDLPAPSARLAERLDLDTTAVWAGALLYLIPDFRETGNEAKRSSRRSTRAIFEREARLLESQNAALAEEPLFRVFASGLRCVLPWIQDLVGEEIPH